MCSSETMNKGLSSSVGNAEEQQLLRSSLHYAKDPRTFRYSLSLLYFLLAQKFDSSISTVFPKPPSLIPAFGTLLEQIVLSSPSARTTVGFERLVSRAILLPEMCGSCSGDNRKCDCEQPPAKNQKTKMGRRAAEKEQLQVAARSPEAEPNYESICRQLQQKNQ